MRCSRAGGWRWTTSACGLSWRSWRPCQWTFPSWTRQTGFDEKDSGKLAVLRALCEAIRDKRELAEQVVSTGGEKWLTQLDDAELLDILRLDGGKAV